MYVTMKLESRDIKSANAWTWIKDFPVFSYAPPTVLNDINKYWGTTRFWESLSRGYLTFSKNSEISAIT